MLVFRTHAIPRTLVAVCLRVVQLALFAFAMIAFVGCARSDPHTITLPDWTFVGPDGATVALHLPTRVDAKLPSAPTEYAIRAHVNVPEPLRGHRLTLAFPFLHARGELRANGQLMVGLTPEMREGFRGTDQPRWRIPAEVTRSGNVDLELTISYRHVMAGWLDLPPRLSDTDDGDAPFTFVATFDRAQAAGCLATVSLTSLLYGIIFVLDRRRKAHGWLTLQGFAGGAGYAIAYVGVSQQIFGVYENSFIPVLLCLGVTASVEFTHAQFGLARPSRWWWGGLAGCVVLAVLFPSPFLGPKIVPPYSCAFPLVNVAYQVPLGWRIWRRQKALAAIVISLSWACLGVLGLPDLFAWGGLGEIAGGLRGACAGLAIVAFMQAIVLSVEHMKTLARADELNESLSSRVDALRMKNDEVSHLNDELRRQIGARADALALALAQASAPRNDGPRLLEAGEIVAKRYRVERSIGEGATGKVYEVTRLVDGARLALKLLDPSSDATEMARFAREAQIISQIDHPNVIRIEDVDVTYEGFFYLIVEFVEGLSLRHHYDHARSLSWNVDVLAQVAQGLSVVHAHGIVHRDLKPGNVLVTSAPDHDARPRVKLADFGISSSGLDTKIPSPQSELLAPLSASVSRTMATVREREVTGPTKPTITRSESLLTETGAWMGTPKYMAPELGGAAKHARPSADVFAFGVMAHELLAGRAPFEESPAVSRVRGDPFARPPRIHASSGELESEIGLLLDQCLAELPDDRPAARVVADALGAYAAKLARGDRTSRASFV